MSVIGILVCYYPFNKDKSSEIFKKILDQVSKKNKMIIVNNKQLIASKFSNVEIISDNAGWEFGAWDLGIEQIKSSLCDDDIIILANDTFCFNRAFTSFDSWLFSKAFKKINKSKGILVGEKCQLKETFELNGYATDSWISTYLFGMNYSTLQQVFPLYNSLFNSLDVIDFDKKKVCIPTASYFLNQHLSQWLFPMHGQHGWYKANDGVINQNLWCSKLHAIYNEKILSVNVCKAGGQLYDVYGNVVMKIISRVFRKLLKLRKGNYYG
ncbi:hypothetical protein VLI49_001501 [Enterobacter kobei]|uniref:hypothetical protein n=1 Tax=Enterobacter kobei TaxID=208224 RepID=UPI001F51ED80|nr:hypothetical protein [Enterobacter kobei]EMC7915978.1 hypothetical protein [Enterobacter kobei]MCH4291970.1 hypothetical protein [Enterobacter kobei]